MKFVLRQITRRAGAGDIVRTRPIAAAEPVIGRGSDCDIVLADLAVNLRHAVLRPGAPGKVVAEAFGDARVEADGVFVTRAELSLRQTPRLVFGNHVLTLEAGEQADEVLVTVTAVEKSVALATDQKGAFQVKSVLFSQRRAAWLLLATILLLCLALPVGQFFLVHNQPRIAADDSTRQWTSGPLTPGHHFLEKNCEACHREAFVAVSDSACLACHQAGLDKAATLHLAADMRVAGSPFPPSPARDHATAERFKAAMPVATDPAQRVKDWFSSFDHPTNRCASCHLEHLEAPSAKSNMPPPVTQEELARDDCAGCHAMLKQKLPDTKIPNVPDWGHHPNFRPLVTVSWSGGRPQIERRALSAGLQDNTGLKFSHQDHLSATGGVARMAEELGKAGGYGAPLACADCHRADAGGKSFQPVEMTRDCAACHALTFARTATGLKTLPHGHPEQVVAVLWAYYQSQAGAPSRSIFGWRPGMSEAQGAPDAGARVMAEVRAVFSPGGACYDCHTVIKPSDPASLDFGIAPVHLTQRYLPDGAFDHSIPAHRQDASGNLICASCHKAQTSALAGDVLLPPIAQCATCHGKSRAQTAGAANADCAECHGFHDTGAPMPVLADAARKE